MVGCNRELGLKWDLEATSSVNVFLVMCELVVHQSLPVLLNILSGEQHSAN